MNYAKAINSILQDRGISQSDLAVKTGIAQATLSRILNNKVRVSLSSVERIAKALDLPKVILDFLAIEDDDIPPVKKRIYKLFYPQFSEIIQTIISHDDTRPQQSSDIK